MQKDWHAVDTGPFRLRSQIEPLHVEHDRLTAILRDTDKSGTPGYRKAVLAHRLLTDLVARSGGTSIERAFVLCRLNEIEAG